MMTHALAVMILPVESRMFRKTKTNNIATCVYAKRLRDTFMDSIKRWPRRYDRLLFEASQENRKSSRDELTFDPFRFDATVCERFDIHRREEFLIWKSQKQRFNDLRFSSDDGGGVDDLAV